MQQRREYEKQKDNPISHIQAYHEMAGNVQLGDSKKMVLSILPEQSTLAIYAKASEQFTLGSRTIAILYFLSGWVSDGRVTDDEFTPYLLIDDKLDVVGWSALKDFLGQGAETKGTN